MRRQYLFSPLNSLLCLCFVVAGINTLQAQSFSGHNWYFGTSPFGIRFSRTDNSPSLVTNKNSFFGNGGGAVASDPYNGNLLFYTDGSIVYDATHTDMFNGSGLNVNSSGNQAAATGPVPGQANQYYVFTNSSNYTTGGTIWLTVVDMTMFGRAIFPAPAQGDVATKNAPITGLTGRSEAMTLIPHSNGTDYWLVTHENGTANYSATLIDDGTTFSAGTPTTVASTAGAAMVAANFSYNAAAGKIAVSPQNSGVNIQLLNFDNATGIITLDQAIPNTFATGTTNQAVYDVEWSNSGRYLYISQNGQGTPAPDVLQYDLTPATPGASAVSVLPPSMAVITRSFGLQMGPDSVIYHLYQSGGNYMLGALSNTDTIAAEVVYNPVAFAGNFNGMQFPSFIPKLNLPLTVTFTTAGTCANSPTSFYPAVTPNADSLVWSFGDGQGSNQWSPIYTYQAAGTYSATVTAYLNGQSVTSLPVSVVIQDNPLQLTLVQDTTACRDEFPPPRGSSSPQQFSVTAQLQGGSPVSTVWSNGDTGLTLTPDSAGYYYVVVTDASGCTAYAGVNVREYGLQDQRANIWYFGTNAGIDFNPLPDGPPVAITGPLDTPEGCAVICDRNGEVVFSTDGQRIFNKDDTEITPLPSPPGIGGEPGSTQSVVIIPVPGDETLYYIFTTQEVYGSYTYELRYSLYDIKLNNGDGGLVKYNELLFRPSTERITGNDNWLIAHEYGNNSFRAYQISTAGIGTPVISSIGSDHVTTSAQTAQGYMKLGPQDRLAVALSTPGTSNVVEIFDFVDSTGLVTNPRVANLNNTNGQVYGVEFSPGGNKLFATITGGTPNLYEFAFDSLGVPYFQQSVTQSGTLGALQIGPDGQIYTAVDGSNSLLTFVAVEDTTQLTPLNSLQSFALAGGSSSNLGLPNFIQNISSPLQGPSIAATGTCLGTPTEFTGTGTDPNIDQYEWFFGDGAGATGQTAEHTYGSAGPYNVALRITNRCGLDTTLTTTVIITAPPDDPTFLAPGQFPTICHGPLTLEATPASTPGIYDDLHFAWSTGDTTVTIVVNQQAGYSVTITDDLGCSSTGTIIVGDNRPIVDLGVDQTACQNTTIAPLDAQNPGTTYQWFINNVNNGNTAQTQAVDTSAPGTFEYKVQVTDPVTTCFTRDSLVFTINATPVFNAVGHDPSGCSLPNGSIDITITSPATDLFTYAVTGPTATTPVSDQPVGGPYNVASLTGGTYSVVVTDQLTGCPATQAVVLNDPGPFTVSGAQLGTCDPTITLEVTNDIAGSFNYRIIDNATGTPVQTGSFTTTTTTFSIPGLNTNNKQYLIELVSGSCTITSAPVTINHDPKVPITALTADPCTLTLSVTTTSASPAPTYAWAAPSGGPAIITPNNQATIQVASGAAAGNYDYTVHVTQAGFCDADETVTLNITNPMSVSLAQSDACSNQVTITATPTPAGSYLYRWSRNGTLDSNLGGPAITATTANNGEVYSVQIYNSVTGCTANSPAPGLTAQVSGTVEVTSLTATSVCAGTPFTITAITNTPVSSYEWSFKNALLSGETASTLTRTEPGVYTVKAILGSCSDDADINVIVAPLTSGQLNDRAMICNDPANTDPNTSQVVLDPGTGFLSYNWLKDGVALGVTTPTYTANEEGLYSVELLNAFNCTSTDQTQVDIECLPKITGPNAFRPGGLNSNFFLYTFFIDDSDFQVFIFNRWGEMVYQSSNREFQWNGGYGNSENKPLPPGTYSYVVKYKSSYRPERGIEEKRGGVVLLR